MLRRLDWIRECGNFEDYRWDDSLPELARINVFYGNNGAGKTSLARAFDDLRNNPDGRSRVSLAIEDTNGTRSTGGNDDSLFDRVMVFSDDFVERNHRLNTESVDMSAVLTIGEQTLEAERRLEELRELVAAKTTERSAALKQIEDSGRAITRQYEIISETVVAAASRARGRYRSRGSFSAGVVRAAFEGSHDEWALLSDDVLASKQSLVQSDNRAELPSGDFRVNTLEELSERVATALRTTPVTIVLDTLAAHPEASSWVQDGMHLHEGTDTCIFCGSPLSTDRVAQIEQHFSDEVSRLQSELRSISEVLDTLDRAAASAIADIQYPDLLFSDLRPAYQEAAAKLQNQAMALSGWTAAVRSRVNAKLLNVLQSDADQVTAPSSINGSELSAVRDQHNRRVVEHTALVQDAAKTVELHYLKEAEQRVADHSQAQASTQETANQLARELVALNAELSALENVEGDPHPSATVLTTEVARLLGRRELVFEAVGDRYKVTRDGEPADGLSVGERTAITLVHFLESVARFNPSRGKAIVVIDDPVSSLDSNIFMGASTYIWSECLTKDHVAQLILLTHNFELFRQWDIQLSGLPRAVAATYTSRLYELRSRHRTIGGRTRRGPQLVVWPPSEAARKKVRSSYHHAFIAVSRAKQNLDANDSLESRLDAQLLFPNVIRRLLETFLAFKRPEWVANFTEAMRKSADVLRESGFTGDADALRLRLTRYSHAYSHSETPVTDQPVNPEEVRTAIAAVFTFVKQLDEEHFLGLCQVVGVDAATLVE